MEHSTTPQPLSPQEYRRYLDLLIWQERAHTVQKMAITPYDQEIEALAARLPKRPALAHHGTYLMDSQEQDSFRDG